MAATRLLMVIVLTPLLLGVLFLFYPSSKWHLDELDYDLDDISEKAIKDEED